MVLKQTDCRIKRTIDVMRRYVKQQNGRKEKSIEPHI